jgi:cardiolipin synthase
LDTLLGGDFSGGNRLRLLTGGDDLFPAMRTAIEGAQHEVWLATYIFHNDATALAMADILAAAAERGVQVRVVVDGFGSRAALPTLRAHWQSSRVALAVFRPLDRWYAWLQPGQMRRLHQKLCVVDSGVAFVGGINIIDDRVDLHHGSGDAPRLDFAVEVHGPLVAHVEQTARAMWSRAAFGHDWRAELRALALSAEPLARARALLRRMRIVPRGDAERHAPRRPAPVRAAFVVRDNLRQRRAIERSYIDAFRAARSRIDLVSPYFYPGQTFRRTLRDAARRGVQVRVLLQGKIDYRIAGLMASVLYEELLAHGVRIFEYQPAFLHAKLARTDDEWCTVGSSNIDPMSLLLNLEANLVVCDTGFAAELGAAFEQALAVSHEVTAPPLSTGWPAVLRRGFVAWAAHWYLRMAGVMSRY